MARFEQYDNRDDIYNSSTSSQASLSPPAVLRELAKQCDVRFNGSNPWDIQVHHRDVYSQILTKGSLGFGESYMDGLWDCERMDELFYRIMRANIEENLVGVGKFALILQSLRHRFFNLQTEKRAYQVGEQHYDIGNDVFEAMLDSTMSYSCGFWQKANTLEQAQLDKLDLICKKLQLKPGEKLLEIGCGWGGLASHAAVHYGVEVLGITISQEQQKLAQQRCKGLPVEIRLLSGLAPAGGKGNLDGHASSSPARAGGPGARRFPKALIRFRNKHKCPGGTSPAGKPAPDAAFHDHHDDLGPSDRASCALTSAEPDQGERPCRTPAFSPRPSKPATPRSSAPSPRSWAASAMRSS